MATLLTIDGAQGEGGGQILRTALGLSLVTGRPVRIERIRAGRQKPGLMRQHLTAVQAAARVGGAEVEGDGIGSQTLTFRPSGHVAPGEFHFATGSAGSATLVLQTVLPALMLANGPSSLVLEGGTHNPMAPPFDFLRLAFTPLLERVGPRLELTLERPGFYPAGGGQMQATIHPAPTLERLELAERGAVKALRARAIVSALSPSIAQRELATVEHTLGWPSEALQIETVPQPRGPGNALLLEMEHEHVAEVVSSFGDKDRSSEQVGRQAAQEARRYLDSNAAVGPHLADQLLIPLALGHGGSFTTLKPTPHTRTNALVIEALLGTRTTLRPAAGGVWEVHVEGAGIR